MMLSSNISSFFFFFNDTATTEIYTLSLHDALPISCLGETKRNNRRSFPQLALQIQFLLSLRSEEHTSELQSPCNLVCRLLLEKKKKNETLPRTTPQIHCSTVVHRSPLTAHVAYTHA